MADRLPCPWLAQQTTLWQAAEQRTAIERARVALLELADRKARNDTNIVQTRLALEKIAADMTTALSPLERARLRSTQAGLEATIARQELENFEGAERALHHDEAVTSAQEALARYEKTLAELTDAHGQLTPEVFVGLRSAIDVMA